MNREAAFRGRRAGAAAPRWLAAIVGYLALFGAVCVGVGLYTNFHVSLNDFWGNLFVANHLDLNYPESFYNNWTPVGYALFLRALSFGDQIAAAYLANILFALALLACVAWLTWVTAGPAWAFLAAVVLSLHPIIFGYTTLPGPDLGGTALVFAGGALLILGALEADARRARALAIGGGLLGGLAALWRYHELVLAFALVLSTTVVARRRWRHLTGAMPSLFLVYSVQWLANVWSGHGLFESGAAFNVYHMMYPLNWHQLTAVEAGIPRSIIQAIALSPGEFIRDYHAELQAYLPLFIPSLAGVLLFKDERLVKISAAIAQTSLLFLLVVAMAHSPRVAIPLIPFTVVQVALLARFLYRAAAGRLGAHGLELVSTAPVLAIVIGLTAGAYVRESVGLVSERKANDRLYRSIQEVLVENGGVRDAKQVFTTDFDLYFPDLDSLKPVVNGGWPRYDTYAYNEVYPELPTESIDVFIEAGQAHGIRYIILSPTHGFGAPLLGALYSGALVSARLEPISTVGSFKIFRVKHD